MPEPEPEDEDGVEVELPLMSEEPLPDELWPCFAECVQPAPTRAKVAIKTSIWFFIGTINPP
jgi:hypothetical protein